MKEIVLEPKLFNEETLVEFSKEFIASKKELLKVPHGYQAVLIVEGKIFARIPGASEKRLSEYSKQLMKKKTQVAFMRKFVSSEMAWGFGNVKVKNVSLDVAFSVGANGKYTVDISEPGKLLSGFDGVSAITSEVIRDKTISTIKSIGVPILARLFTELNISAFELSSQLPILRDEMITALRKETAFTSLGLQIHDFTVEGTMISDEDMKRIQEKMGVRFNSRGKNDETAGFDEVLSKITQRLEELEENLEQVRQEQGDRNYEESYEELKDEFGRLFEQRLKKAELDIQKRLENSVSEKITEENEIWKDTILSGLDERIQAVSYENKEEKVNPDLSIDSLIQNAHDDVDYALAASAIYYGIEDSLINKCHLTYRNKRFVIPYSEFLELAETSNINGVPLLKRNTKNGWELLPANVVESNHDGSPKTVEMYPVVRFLKAGLSPTDAKHAEKFSIVINKLRHPSPVNKEFIVDFFKKTAYTKNGYLQEAVSFFKDKNLMSK